MLISIADIVSGLFVTNEVARMPLPLLLLLLGSAAASPPPPPPPPGYALVGKGNCLPNTPNCYSYNASATTCAAACGRTAGCLGFDWSPSGDSAGSCRARVPGRQPAPAACPAGYLLDPSGGACSNITGANGAADHASCYRRDQPPPFRCPVPPPLPNASAVLSACRGLLGASHCSASTPCGSSWEKGVVPINCSGVLALDGGGGACGYGVNSPALALWVGGNFLAGVLQQPAGAVPPPPGTGMLRGGYNDCAPDFVISDGHQARPLLWPLLWPPARRASFC